MNKKIAAISILIIIVFSGLPVSAVTQTYYHPPSDLKQKIAALGITPVMAFPIPVLFGVEIKDISLNFGEMRSTGRPHPGEDIMAVRGTPVVSPTAAVVLRTDIFSGGGNTVYTANPGGEEFVYMHLDRFGEGIVAGKILQEGSLIGYVGYTGSAVVTAPHLHLEIYDNAGTLENPFIRLTTEFTPAQKISFLTTILAQTSDPVSLSQFLVKNFRSTFTADIQNNIILPSFITDALAPVPVSPPIIGNLPAGDLMIGSSGSAVIRLQQFLIAKATGPASTRLVAATATGYFGSITKTALAEYQNISGISPADGYYGPATRSLVEASSSTTANASFDRNLTVGMTGNDVKILQVWLNTHGYVLALSGPGSLGNETTTFGGLTRVALAKFQAGVGISPAVGYFGPITRAYLSTHY